MKKEAEEKNISESKKTEEDKNIKGPSNSENDTKKSEDIDKDLNNSDFLFIQEKIKERPINRKKLVRKMLFTAGMAIIFGIVACATFIVLEPVFGNMVKEDDDVAMQQIVLPEAEDEDDIDVNVYVSDAPFDETTTFEEKPIEEMNLTDESISDNEVQPIATVPDFEIELDDYQVLYRKMYSLSVEVSKSLVTVMGVSESNDILYSELQSTNKTIGIIIGDNGSQLLILADGRNIDSDENILITFCDGEIYSAQLKAADEDTGLAIYAVDLANLKYTTKQSYVIATLGNSYSATLPGSALIAVGNPIGTASSSICYGAITSTDTRVSQRDSYYQILTTDIFGSRNAYGFLVNVRGQFIGIITPDYHSEDMENIIYAYGISSIRSLAEDMSNEKTNSYLGLYTSDISMDTPDGNIPVGAFITKVEDDSPAMNVGIVPGDIITKVGDIYISCASDYVTCLRNINPGENITITVSRQTGDGYKEAELTVTTGEYKFINIGE